MLLFSWPRLKGVCCRRLRLALAAVAAVSLSLSVPISVPSLSLSPFSLSRARSRARIQASTLRLRCASTSCDNRSTRMERTRPGERAARQGRSREQPTFFRFFPSTLDRRPSIVFSLLFLSLTCLPATRRAPAGLACCCCAPEEADLRVCERMVAES